MSKYSFKKTHETDVGPAFDFDGPGLARCGGCIVVRDGFTAEHVAHMLSRAYEAGRQAKAREIREALEVRKGP